MSSIANRGRPQPRLARASEAKMTGPPARRSTSASYCRAVCRAPAPSVDRRSSSVARRSRAAAIPAIDSGATSRPLTSCSTISRGPDAQSKLATGTPGRHRLLRDQREALGARGEGADAGLGPLAALSVTPRAARRGPTGPLCASRGSARALGPSPKMRSRQSGSSSATGERVDQLGELLLRRPGGLPRRAAPGSSVERGAKPGGQRVQDTTIRGAGGPQLVAEPGRDESGSSADDVGARRVESRGSSPTCGGWTSGAPGAPPPRRSGSELRPRRRAAPASTVTSTSTSSTSAGRAPGRRR